MALVFSCVFLHADNGAEEEFLCGGIPECSDDLEGWNDYDNFVEDNADSEYIHVESATFLYGEGESDNADEDDIKRLTAMGDSLFDDPDIQQIQEHQFSILLDHEEDEDFEMEMM